MMIRTIWYKDRAYRVSGPVREHREWPDMSFPPYDVDVYEIFRHTLCCMMEVDVAFLVAARYHTQEALYQQFCQYILAMELKAAEAERGL